METQTDMTTTASVSQVNGNNALAGPGCSWWQKPNPSAGGVCQFSGMGVVQTVFNLPAKVVEAQLVMLPAALVPVAGLAVNAAVWYFLGRWALRKVWK